MKRSVISTLLMLTFCASALAQNQNYLSEGTTFGKSIAPTQPGQVVNPANVNSSAWSGNTSSTTTVPSGLGGFSKPITSASTFDSAKTMGLVGLGNQAMDNCAAYTPGSGDAARDQECAAVNFLSQRCLTPSGAQANVMSGTGGSAQSQLNSSYCAGSYGKGANQFDFANQVKSSDSIFSAVGGSQKDAGKTTGEICTQKAVVTKPAEFELNNCIKTFSSDVETCSQVLKASCQPLAGLDGCDQGGIIPGSWAGDMATSFSADGNGDFTLSFGTFADNYWGGWGATYDRTLSFQIKDPEIISKFMLSRASFDDWLMLQVNGAVVYVGPRGGNQLSVVNRRLTVNELSPRSCRPYSDEYTSGWLCGTPAYDWEYGTTLTNTSYYQSCSSISGGWSCSTPDPNNGLVQYSDTGFGSPELRTNWNIALSIDIRPHLKVGTNVIFMRTIVAGAGEGAIQFKTRQFCPRICNATWENQCSSHERRSGTVLGTP